MELGSVTHRQKFERSIYDRMRKEREFEIEFSKQIIVLHFSLNSDCTIYKPE